MKKIMIWGIGTGYDEVMLHLKADIIQVKIEIIGLVSSYKESISYLDGNKVILPDEIKNYKFDYIIIANKEHDEEIRKSAIKMGIDNKKIIRYRVACNNLFDFDKYNKLLENNISIISDDCWGGLVYNTLGLQFNSPFVNLSVRGNDSYYKLANDVKYYLKQPLEMVGDSEGFVYAIGKIGDVELNFNHSRNFAEAKENWDRRVKRFNFENYIVKKSIFNDEDARRFSNLLIKDKIGFYNKEMNLNGIFCLRNYEKSIYKKSYNWIQYIRELATTDLQGLKEYDIFKILAKEEDFLRVR